jgi:Xaa-Pro aminopeptidase
MDLIEDCDASSAIITTPANLRYFFGYVGESYERFCCGILSEDRSALVVPKLDEAKAETSSVESVFAWSDNEGYEDAFKNAISESRAGNGPFGCEDGISFGMMQSITKAWRDVEFNSVSEKISGLRLRKDGEEIIALKNAARILRKAYEEMDDFLRIGKTENDAAFRIKKALKNYGADNADFCAVQSGKNGAVPHMQTSDKRIAKGDMVVVDISITEPSGYFADYTRTFVMGKPSARESKVYDVVRSAQEAGISAATKGASAGEPDNAARGIIEKAGFGENFFHRAGHGIGLEVHEPPWIRQGNEMKLEEGMVFTVEPGIYLFGKFGVRIEDNLLVGKSGTRNLTGLEHELVEL